MWTSTIAEVFNGRWWEKKIMFFKKRYLRKQWIGAHDALGVVPDFDEFESIINCYNQKNRYHHGINHLVYGLKVLGKLDPVDYALVRFAFFYHDILMKPEDPDFHDEIESAKVAVSYLRPYMNHANLERVRILIEETAHHQISTCTDPLWPYMNDADLAILGTSWKIYARYARNVRSELQPIYGRSRYAKGSREFLKNFARGPIFRTAAMQAYESCAQSNLLREHFDIGYDWNIND